MDGSDDQPATAVPAPWVEVIDALCDRTGFVSASFTGARRGTAPPARKVTVRPVDLRTGPHLQISSFDGVTTHVTNVPVTGTADAVTALLHDGYATVYVKTLEGDLQLQHSRKGSPRIVRHRATATTIDTDHDRSKPRLLDPGAPFLGVVGITDQHGRVKPTAAAKYRQVERFLEILTHSWPDPIGEHGPLHVIDLGCGAGVLTLATHDHLSRMAPGSTTTGVDTKSQLMAELDDAVRALGWHDIAFRTGSIDDVEPERSPDLVIALHACDTATDDALARAISWRARVVLSAPCCQHDLQAQLDRDHVPDGLGPLMRHGIVRERLGDLLTDTLRAEIMTAHGYRTDVIEFVSTEHTAKNLMIRAVLDEAVDPEVAERAARSAEALATAWGVEPALARRVGYRPGPPSGIS